MTELAESESGYLGGKDECACGHIPASEPHGGDEPEREQPQSEITQIKPRRARDLVERAVFVSIKLSRPGVNKKISSEHISFDSESDDLGDALNGEPDGEAKTVDRKLIRVSKRIIDCKEYKAISTLDGKIKRYIRSRCTDSLVRDGIFLLPLALVNEVDHEVTAFKERRVELIEEYGAVYDQRVEEALERLGPEGNRNDYPPWSTVKEQFALDMQYLSLAAPTVLGNISEKILEREQEKVAAQFKSAVEVSCQSLREGMADLVNHLADRLTPDDSGEKKVLRKSSIEKLVDFLNVFDARNLADDAALADLVKKARGLLIGVDAKVLRDDDHIRTDVLKGFSEIKESISGLIVAQPTRAITFED